MLPYRRKTKTFRWPKGQKSEITPVDLFYVGICPAPTPRGVSFYEVFDVPVMDQKTGGNVSAFTMTAIFYSVGVLSCSSRGGVGLTLPGLGGGANHFFEAGGGIGGHYGHGVGLGPYGGPIPEPFDMPDPRPLPGSSGGGGPDPDPFGGGGPDTDPFGGGGPDPDRAPSLYPGGGPSPDDG
jgi:hypothetical protein